jgi:tight adherence protein B
MTTGTANRLRIEPRPEFAKIVRVEKSFAAAESGGSATGINGRFDRSVLQSGTTASPDVILRLCILGGVTGGGALFVATGNLLWTALALALGAALPIAVLLVARTLRLRRIERQIPPLIDGLLQAARNGCGLAKSLEMAAIETRAPLADEIGLAVRRLRMGIGIEAAFEDLPERTGLAGMRMLVAALANHEQTGCDLVSLLERLSSRVATAV